jgi:PAT family beta-lactamase induction signal transducer AmpG
VAAALTVEAEPRPGWLEAARVYRRPRVVAMLFLGFSAGLPFLLVFSTLSAWLADADVTRSLIGFFSWVGITYSIKVIWAPVIDRLPLPLLTPAFGRRRAWMLAAQCGIAAGLLAMSATDPVTETVQLALLALWVAFSAATQDIVIDAYRIEAVDKRLQGAMAATYILGYRIALLAAGAGAFYVAEFNGWPSAYVIMALLMLIGIVTTLLIREPQPRVAVESKRQERRVAEFLERSAHLPRRYREAVAWVIGAVVCPLTDFFTRNGKLALWILALVGVYRLSDITMGVMANPFYLDHGFSKLEIANVSKIFGFFMSIGGALIGGLLVARYGIMKPLLLGGVLVAVTNLLFAWLAVSEPDLLFLACVISADNLSGGLAGAAFIAYLSSLTSTAYTATQYALFSSLMTLPAKFLGGFSGVVVDVQGYPSFFLYASLIGVPAVVLVVFLSRMSDPDRPAA